MKIFFKETYKKKNHTLIDLYIFIYIYIYFYIYIFFFFYFLQKSVFSIFELARLGKARTRSYSQDQEGDI